MDEFRGPAGDRSSPPCLSNVLSFETSQDQGQHHVADGSDRKVGTEEESFGCRHHHGTKELVKREMFTIFV